MNNVRRGRPPSDDPKTERFDMKVSPSEKRKILENGGAEYLRSLMKKDEKNSDQSGLI